MNGALLDAIYTHHKIINAEFYDFCIGIKHKLNDDHLKYGIKTLKPVRVDEVGQ